MEFNISSEVFEDFSYLLHTNDPNEAFDVKIKVGKGYSAKEFKAHSTILSTRSSYFRDALSNQNKESGFFILENPDILPSAFDIILKYFYSGKLTIEKKVKILYVIIAAYDLQMKNVVEHLESYLKENDSAWKLPDDFFIVSKQKQLKQLQEQALKCACADPRVIFKSKAFLKLDEGFLIQLLKRDDLEMDELEIFGYLIKWGTSNTSPTLNRFMRRWWSSNSFMILEKTLRNCIPHIRFVQMKSNDYNKQVRDKFKEILPNGLDYQVTQHFRQFYNPLVKIPENDNILPPRVSPCPFDSSIINARDAALISSWIDGRIKNRHNKLKKRYQFKNIPFNFERIYRGSVDGFDNYKNLYENDRVVVVMKVRGTGEIIGAYNPFGWGIGTMKYVGDKLFKDVVSRYFIFSLTNRGNPVLSLHKKGTKSNISNGAILFGDSDLSINGNHCTSRQRSYRKKIIDRGNFELEELEIFRITDKNIRVTLRRNLIFVLVTYLIFLYFFEMIIHWLINVGDCTNVFRWCY